MASRSDVGTYTYGNVNAGPHEVMSISGTVNTSYTYDGDGNMKTGNGRTAVYTSFDMPSSITESGASEAFIYGPEHQRIKRTSASKVTIYVNPDNAGGLSYEKDMTTASSTIEDRVYISAGGDPVVLLKRANGTGSFVPYYLHRDPIGSTVAITSSAASVLERLSYEPFGKRRAPDGASDPTDSIVGVNSDRGFTDHEHLDDIALIHMNGRVFDPLVGRFLSADPNVQNGYDQQSYNRYSYISNSPTNARDPTGYFSLRSLFGDVSVQARQFNKFQNRVDPVRRDVTRYVGTHQWALSLVEAVAAYETAGICGGCGADVIAADVTYANTGSLSDAAKAAVLTDVELYAYSWVDTSNWALAALETGTLGGTFSVLSGRSFDRGFELSAGGSLAQSAWGWYVGHAPGWGGGTNHTTPNLPCTNVDSNCYVPALTNSQNIPAEDADKNVFGFNTELTDKPDGQNWYQSGKYSIKADSIPGLQAVAQFHDTWMNALVFPSTFSNFVSMPFAAAGTYFSLIGGHFYFIPNYK